MEPLRASRAGGELEDSGRNSRAGRLSQRLLLQFAVRRSPLAKPDGTQGAARRPASLLREEGMNETRTSGRKAAGRFRRDPLPLVGGVSRHSFVARMERSEIRGRLATIRRRPGWRFAPSGLLVVVGPSFD